MLKSEFPPEQAWFVDLEVHLDLGYQGIQSDYQGEYISIPHKKPRKSKKKPNPQLSPEQKRENRALAKLRVFVEHRSSSPVPSGYDWTLSAVSNAIRFSLPPIATAKIASKMMCLSLLPGCGTFGSNESIGEQVYS